MPTSNEFSELEERIRVRAQILTCRSCDARDSCSTPVPFSGMNPASLVVIGEAPGATEDKEGEPFVGPAGRLLRKVIDDAFGGRKQYSQTTNPPVFKSEGVSDYVSYLNAVSCFPGRTPTAKQIKACSNNLWAQLDILRPSYGLLVGGVALSALVPGMGGGRDRNNRSVPPTTITECRGKWVQLTGIGRNWTSMLMVTWHPSAVLREGGLKSPKGLEFQEDVKVLAEGAIRKGLVQPVFVTSRNSEQAQLGLPE
jgi:uracil-DNA glycosylase